MQANEFRFVSKKGQEKRNEKKILNLKKIIIIMLRWNF